MTLARVLFDLAAVVMWLRVVVALAGRPAARWRTGWLGKGLCLVVSVTCFYVGWGMLAPWGAAVVWWRVLVLGRDPFELPMADGRRMR